MYLQCRQSVSGFSSNVPTMLLFTACSVHQSKQCTMNKQNHENVITTQNDKAKKEDGT